MKKILLTISLSLVAVCFAFGQISQGEFIIGGSLGEYGSSIIKTTDRGYVTVGLTYTFGAGNGDLYVVKLDSVFNIQWTRTVGGSGYDGGRSVVQTSDGGYAVAGFTRSYGAGTYDVYIIKLDSNGTLKWTRTLGGVGDDEANCIIETYDKGLVVVGQTFSYGAGLEDVYVIKLDSSGGLKWAKTIGGSNYELANVVLQTNDNGLLIGGATDSYGLGGAYFVKLDSLGNLLWTKVISGAPNPLSLVQTKDKGFAFVSQATIGTGYWASIFKLDSTLNVQWNIEMSDTINNSIDTTRDLAGVGILQTQDSGYIVSGYSYVYDGDNTFGNSILMTLKVNSKGQFQWDHIYDTVFGSGQEQSSIIQTRDGGYIVLGQTDIISGGGSNFYLVKLDKNANTCSGMTFPPVFDVMSVSYTSGGVVGSGGTFTAIDSGMVSSGGIVTNICSTPTSVNTISPPINSVEVYPNPSNGVFTVAISNYELGISNQKTGIEVYNVLGEKVYSNTFSTLHSQFSIDISNNPPGIYFYRITSEKGDAIASGKLMIEK